MNMSIKSIFKYLLLVLLICLTNVIPFQYQWLMLKVQEHRLKNQYALVLEHQRYMIEVEDQVQTLQNIVQTQAHSEENLAPSAQTMNLVHHHGLNFIAFRHSFDADETGMTLSLQGSLMSCLMFFNQWLGGRSELEINEIDLDQQDQQCHITFQKVQLL